MSFDTAPFFCYAAPQYKKGASDMEKFIPYEKLSKKEKRKRDALLRNTWGPLNPVTRKSRNPKAYDRQKARKWIDDPLSVPFSYR